MPGHVDREDAPGARHISDSQNTLGGLNAALADVKPKPKARSILAALSKGQTSEDANAAGRPPQ